MKFGVVFLLASVSACDNNVLNEDINMTIAPLRALPDTDPFQYHNDTTDIEGFVHVNFFEWRDFKYQIPIYKDVSFGACWRRIAKSVRFERIEGFNSLSLEGVSRIGEGLTIKRTDIKYLGNNVAPHLSYIGLDADGVSLRIERNYKLQSLGSGFPVLTQLVGKLFIQSNPYLTDFSGLDNLSCHGGIYLGDPSRYCQNCPDRIINLPRCDDLTFPPTTAAPSQPPGVIAEIITTTSPLPNTFLSLTSVLGKIHVSFLSDESISNLNNIETVGDEISIHNSANLESIEGAFPKLRDVGKNIILLRTNLALLENAFDGLTRIGNSLAIVNNDNLRGFRNSFDKLERIEGKIWIENNPKLNVSDFGGLVNIVCHGGIIECDNCPEILWSKPRCTDPPTVAPTFADVIINERQIGNDNKPEGLQLDKRDDGPSIITGSFFLMLNDARVFSFGLTRTVEVGNTVLISNNERLRTFTGSFTKLREIKGDFLIQNNPKLESIQESFINLEKIHGEVAISGNYLESEDFNVFSNLKCHGGIVGNDSSKYCPSCPEFMLQLPRCSNETTTAAPSLHISGLAATLMAVGVFMFIFGFAVVNRK